MSAVQDLELKQLTEMLESMSDRAGAGLLLELINHPNQPIHASQLRHLHSLPLLDRPEYRSDENSQPYKRKTRQANPFDESTIRFCDQRTINEIKKRLKQLQIQKAEAKDWNDLAHLEEIYREEQILIDYLKKAFNRNGQPRYLRNKSKDDYSYVKKAISRIIEKIRKLDPKQADLIENHLKTGLCFRWESDDINW
jgi:hypothetical protein